MAHYHHLTNVEVGEGSNYRPLYYTPSGGGGSGGYQNDYQFDPNAYKYGSAAGVLGTVVTGVLLSSLVAKLGSFQGRKKRSVESSELTNEIIEDEGVIYELLKNIDQEDCIAKAVCQASVKDPLNIERNQKLLIALGILSGIPMSLKDLSEVRAKYQYAAFVGRTQKEEEDVNKSCDEAFRKCSLSAEDVLEVITGDVEPCEPIVTTLERILLKENTEEERNWAFYEGKLEDVVRDI